MRKVYHYVGPETIRLAVRDQSPGVGITSFETLREWLQTHQSESASGLVMVTYVVRCDEILWLADRHAEHVACAEGEPVLAAGEIGFVDSLTITEVTNQSTGYCPEPECWSVVETVLERLSLQHPGEFTRACEFRRCDGCGEIQIVKDNWFFCTMCEEELSPDWNLTD